MLIGYCCEVSGWMINRLLFEIDHAIHVIVINMAVFLHIDYCSKLVNWHKLKNQSKRVKLTSAQLTPDKITVTK